MNEILRQMIELTEVDRGILELGGQLARYPAMLAAMESAETEQQAAIRQAQAELESAVQDRRRAEKEIAGLREQVKRLERQQMEAKTNKEYQAFIHEIETVHGKIDEFETVGLEKLEAEDTSGRRKAQAEARLKELKAAHETERRRIAEQTEDKKARLARLREERQGRLTRLPEEWHEPYEVLNQRYPGTACMPIDGGTCGGCHWQLVPATLQAARGAAQPVRCEHCQRFIFTRG